MQALTLSEIKESVLAKRLHFEEDLAITSVVFDSRKARPGSLFVPLQGQRDGHEFAAQAQALGAVASFWSRPIEEAPEGLALIEVADTLVALQALARYYLAKLHPKVVAITGSAGKTTTKDLTAAALSAAFRVHKTQGNYNNEIGLPMTILAMPEGTEVVVLEMGMSERGEIEFLSQLAKPDIAIITMIGESHLAFLGSRDNIAQAKLEILSGLKEKGVFIYPGDEPLLTDNFPNEMPYQMLSVGLNEQDDVYAMDCQCEQYRATFYTNLSPTQRLEIPVTGSYNIHNALYACAAAYSLGISVEQIAEPLSRFELSPDRMTWIKGLRESELLNDTYNANPTAMRAVVSNFAQLPRNGQERNGRKLYVLGDMLELGPESAAFHESVADALKLGLSDQVLLLGNEMSALYRKLLTDKLCSPGQVHYFKKDHEALHTWLYENIQAGDQILFKASHSMRLSEIVQALAQGDMIDEAARETTS